MLKPTFMIFRTEDIEYWDKYPDEYEDMVNDGLEEFNDLNDVEYSREQFIEYLKGFKTVDSSTEYVGGDPTHIEVVYHAETDTYYMGQHYWDSWNGNGGWDDPYGDAPTQVVKQQVMREEWVEV